MSVAYNYEDANYGSSSESKQFAILEREKRRRKYIKDNQDDWKIIGQQNRIARKLINISHYELAKCIGVSPSVILAFEEGRPVQRPRFVENAYRTALIAFFYSYRYSREEYYPHYLYPDSNLKDLVVNLCNDRQLALDEVSELIKAFKFDFKIHTFESENRVNFYADSGMYLFSVNLKEEV